MITYFVVYRWMWKKELQEEEAATGVIAYIGGCSVVIDIFLIYALIKWITG